MTAGARQGARAKLQARWDAVAAEVSSANTQAGAYMAQLELAESQVSQVKADVEALLGVQPRCVTDSGLT